MKVLIATSICLALTMMAPLPALADEGSALRSLIDQDRREYEALRVRREQLFTELRDQLRNLDEGAQGRPGDAERLSLRATREATLEDKEAALSGVLRRGHELRRSLTEKELLLQALGTTGTEESAELSGTWTLTFEGAPDGRLIVVQSGALVSGSYELGSFSRGMFFGHGGRGKMTLTFIDEKGELFAFLKGSTDGARTPTLVGTWVRANLASGAPAQGAWSARKGR